MRRNLLICGGAHGLTICAMVGSFALLAGPALAQAPKVGDPPEARNMRLVGCNDLQARSAYQPIIHKQGDRYIAYVGHHGGTQAVPKPVNPLNGQAEFNGTSIIDVTDPKQPKYLAHIPGVEGLGGAGRRRRWCAPATASAAEGRSERRLSAANLRQTGARESGTWPIRQIRSSSRASRRQGHAQELVGVRHRHRLSRFRRGDLAHAAHDRDL